MAKNGLQIDESGIASQVVSMKLTGTTAMLMHNTRLANPMNPYTKKLKSLVNKKKKTEEELVEIAQIETRAGFYETNDGLVGIEMQAVYASIRDGAKAHNLGKDVTRALLWKAEAVPIEIDGKTWTCDEYMKRPDSVDYRPVVVNGRRTMRARPKIQEGWTTMVEFTLIVSIMEISVLPPILEKAGRFRGLYDYRPIFGQYKAEIVER